MNQSFNMTQAVKRRFFAMRNGAVAAKMKEAGAPYRINFGLLQHQVAEIARQVMEGTLDERPERLDTDTLAQLARSLRDNSSTRESMLIAPMIFPVEMLGPDEARRWLLDTPTPEVADTLCLKLLRRAPFAPAMLRELLAEAGSLDDTQLYTLARLALNLLILGHITPAEALDAAHAATSRDGTAAATVGRQIADRLEPR